MATPTNPKSLSARTQCKRAWPDGMPCFYEFDPVTLQTKWPIVRHIFCTTECSVAFKEAHPELPLTVVAQRSIWSFIVGMMKCKQCGKILWHQFQEKEKT